MIKVYHQIVMSDKLGGMLPGCLPSQETHDLPFTPEHFKLVAIIDIPDADYGDSFRITNHIDYDWEQNPEVRYLDSRPNRGTSVGDIIELQSGVRLVCASIGWEVYGIPGIQYFHPA